MTSTEALPSEALPSAETASTAGFEMMTDEVKSKPERIQELVRQMKSGNITKSELFTQLSLLQRSSAKQRGGGGGIAAGGSSSMSSAASTFAEDASEADPDSSEAEESPMTSSAMSRGRVTGLTGLGARGSTPERRAQIVQRLLDEKRRQRQQRKQEAHPRARPGHHGVDDLSEESSTVPPPPPSSSPRSAQTSSAASSWAHWESTNVMDDESVGIRDDTHLVLERMRRQHNRHQGGSGSGARQGESPGAGRVARPASAPRGGRATLTHRGGSSFWYESRKRRMQQDLLEKQMEECTFQPKIRDLPAEYGTGRHPRSGTSFTDRVETWNRRKAEETERKQREKQQAELEGCTFQPQINRKDSRGRPGTPGRRSDAGSSFAGSPPGPGSGRFGFQAGVDAGDAGSDAGASQVHRDGDPYERLYRQNHAEKLAKLQAKARAEEEERLRKECTFKPQLSATSQASGRSRYMSGTLSRPGSARPASRGGVRGASDAVSEGGSSATSSRARRRMGWDENCTFTPQTNPVHPKMEAAQVYLSNDIFTRLSQPREALYQAQDVGGDGGVLGENGDRANQSDAGRVMDMETFMASLGSGKASPAARRPTSASGRRQQQQQQQRQRQQQDARPSTAEGRRPLSSEERAQRRQSFESFLARQRQTENRKQQKIAQVARQTNPSHKPKLCAKSVEMASRRAKGTFLQRVAKGAIRKEHEAVRRKSNSLDPECTFQPKITRAAKARPARSTLEMSRGDSLRKETNARLMKLRAEQDELQDLTFTPELQARARSGVESRLKILTEPETYIRRLQHKDTLHSHKQTKAAQEQEMKELEECTFKPEIHDAPAYVKRIVRSLALAKPAREAQAAAAEQNARPDWR